MRDLQPGSGHVARGVPGGCPVADVPHHEADDVVQHRRVAEVVPSDYVLEEHRAVGPVQGLRDEALRRRVLQQGHRWEGAVADVVVEEVGVALPGAMPKDAVLGEGQRGHVDLKASPGQFCRQLRRQHLGVGAGDVDVRLLRVERCDGDLPPPDVLDLVEEQVGALPGGQPGLHQGRELRMVPRGVRGVDVEVDVHDPVPGDAGVYELPDEHVHQCGLAASPDAGDDLDERGVPGGPELVHVAFPGEPFRCVDFSHGVVYVVLFLKSFVNSILYHTIFITERKVYIM